MEVKDFIRETLIHIAAGVSEAQDQVRELGGVVNPATLGKKAEGSGYFSSIGEMHHVFLVDFDIAVSVAESSGLDGKTQLSIPTILSVGGGGKSTSESSATNRISFKVPLAMPVDATSKVELELQITQAREARQESVRRVSQARSEWDHS